MAKCHRKITIGLLILCLGILPAFFITWVFYTQNLSQKSSLPRNLESGVHRERASILEDAKELFPIPFKKLNVKK